MNERLRKLLAEAQEIAKEARDIFEKAQSEKRDMTEEERADFQAKLEEAVKKQEEATRVKADTDALRRVREIADSVIDIPEEEDSAGPTAKAVSLGEHFVKGSPYRDFMKKHPSGVGASTTVVDIAPTKVGTLENWFANRKAAGDLIVSDDAHLPSVRVPTVDQVVRPRLTLLDLVSRGDAAGDFEYLQIIDVTRSAAIVPEATAIDDDSALKPLSDLGTELAYARAYTYADGFPVTNQLLSDAPALATFMDNELRYNLDGLIEDKLLNADGSPGEPTGLEYTTGVQQEEYAGTEPIDLVKAVRKAITKVQITGGGTVTAVVLSPEDEENIDLMQDQQNRFFGQGPFGTGPNTLWGRPRVISEKLSQGIAWVGEWNQISLLDREGLSILAFNQHSDWARRNLTYVRAELRAMQVIWRPVRFCKVAKAL